MPFFSLFSSDSDTVSNVNEVTTGLTDNRVTDSGNIGGNITLGETGGDVNLSQTDYGAIDAGKEVSLAALEFNADSVEGGYKTATDLFMGAGNIVEQSIDLTGETFKSALSSINENARYYSQQTGQTIDRALAFASTGETSDQSESLNKLIMVIGVIGGLFVAAKFLKGKA